MEIPEDFEEKVKGYVGGQMEVQNTLENYLFRGEIKDASVTDGVLTIELSWLAQGEGFPPLPKRWVKAEPKPYRATLDIYRVCDDSLGRLRLQSPIVGEVVVLFPPDGSRLDPAEVEGLEVEVEKE
jgi:hypothetical protein